MTALDRPVVDASVAIKWFLITEVHAIEADRLLRGERTLLVPDLIFPEVGNITWKQVRKGILPQAEAINIVGALAHFGLIVYPSYPLIESAVKIACETGRTAYDSLYLALAIQEETVLVTADQKFYNALVNTPYAAFLCWIESVR